MNSFITYFLSFHLQYKLTDTLRIFHKPFCRPPFPNLYCPRSAFLQILLQLAFFDFFSIVLALEWTKSGNSYTIDALLTHPSNISSTLVQISSLSTCWDASTNYASILTSRSLYPSFFLILVLYNELGWLERLSVPSILFENLLELDAKGRTF